MADIQLNIQPYENALARLREGFVRFNETPDDDQLRDGLIQRYEFTYELSHKTLKRFLELTSPNPASIDEMSFQGMIRTGNERGLLKGDWTDWKKYRNMGAKTSHAYAAEIAVDVVEEIPTFVEEAEFLLLRLKAALV